MTASAQEGVLSSETSVLSIDSTILGQSAVPFWGHTSQILSSLSPKRDCSAKRGIDQACSFLITAVRTYDIVCTAVPGMYEHDILYIITTLSGSLTLLGPQSRFGDKPLIVCMLCPQLMGVRC